MNELLFKSTAVVSSMTLVSRIFGFVRDIVIARLFGASLGADVFFVAFKIPNFLRRLFAEGAFSQAFIPVLAEYRHRGDMDLKKLIDATSGTLSIFLFIITLLGVVSAPLLIAIFAPGFLDDPNKTTLASTLLKITFPYLFFISLTALAGAILNSFGHFAIPAVTPVFLNLSLIGCAIWLSPQLNQPIVALAWGVFVGGLVQLLFQLPFLIKIGKLPKPVWGWRNSGVQKILKLMLPAIFGVSVAQISLLIDTLLASFLVTGSISWLYYSDRLVEFPLGIFGVALATVILPNLSTKHVSAAKDTFSQTIDWALRWTFIVSIPAALGLIFLAEPLLLTLFQYGEFTTDDAHKASLSLIAYASGLLPFVLIKVLATAYFSRQDTTTPVRIAIIALVVNMLLNIILMMQYAHVGLAMATALSAALNASLLYAGLRKSGIYKPQAKWLTFAIKLIIANSVMLTFLFWQAPDTIVWIESTVWQRVVMLSGLVTGAAISYFVVLGITGISIKTLLKTKK